MVLLSDGDRRNSGLGALPRAALVALAIVLVNCVLAESLLADVINVDLVVQAPRGLQRVPNGILDAAEWLQGVAFEDRHVRLDVSA
jgi:hypothetical protein